MRSSSATNTAPGAYTGERSGTRRGVAGLVGGGRGRAVGGSGRLSSVTMDSNRGVMAGPGCGDTVNCVVAAGGNPQIPRVDAVGWGVLPADCVHGSVGLHEP